MFWIGLILIVIAVVAIVSGFLFTDDIGAFTSLLFGGMFFIFAGAYLMVNHGNISQ